LEYLKRAKHFQLLVLRNGLKTKIERSDFNKVFDTVNVIHYGLDLTLFDIRDRVACRNILQLDLNKVIILLIATDLRNYRKGFDMALEVMQKMEANKNIEFLLVGEIGEVQLPVNARSVGTIQEDK